ncbi:NYN domain-containing protein [Sediminimonas sp.]|uniref:NYN domain-containing protein n=1 Tax=Sediminimonas sp. TaxID=2823379 RepID=UPI0025F08823|nr:NYN domain-containing protein [Sediminimonas sp.]
MSNVHLFWDNSNIFISAKYVANRREGYFEENSVRIEFQNLYSLALADRPADKAICVGSVPPELAAVWSRLRSAGVHVELFERGADSGQEQGVDQCLQVHMLRSLADNSSDPGTVVLLTGDGSGFDDGVGFHADLDRMQKMGWGIEVVAWEISCKKTLKAWAEDVGTFTPLEDHYESITFLQTGRRAKPNNLTKRKLAKRVAPEEKHP